MYNSVAQSKKDVCPFLNVASSFGAASAYNECALGYAVMMTLVCRVRFVFLLILPLTACGSNPAAPSEPAATITIGAAGVFPAEVRLKAWGQVRFVNNDSRPHTMVSDPVDVHSQCPPLNLVGALLPGETRNTGTLNLPGMCGFHDHVNKSDAIFRGRIVVE